MDPRWANRTDLTRRSRVLQDHRLGGVVPRPSWPPRPSLYRRSLSPGSRRSDQMLFPCPLQADVSQGLRVEQIENIQSTVEFTGCRSELRLKPPVVRERPEDVGSQKLLLQSAGAREE
ncbi:unnamed protein product [Pleuronectes platessa]|uniref:Uncharacterized protein n=1 Tax=Pleuronectes platessa TaxID=8262 RepID=A0A9N7YHA5_PLEPL|nr:unnamed protein product [Pleuronectes platessa]